MSATRRDLVQGAVLSAVLGILGASTENASAQPEGAAEPSTIVHRSQSRALHKAQSAGP